MFGDIFGVTDSQLNESNKTHTINFAALVTLLVEKEVFTVDEYLKMRALSTHAIDQESAAMRDEAMEVFKEEHPSLHKLFGQLMGSGQNESERTS